MPEHTEQKQLPIQPRKLGMLGFIFEVLQGIAMLLGLGLLSMLESVRDVFFRLLDRLNLKPRPRARASAFPPGSPRRRNPA